MGVTFLIRKGQGRPPVVVGALRRTTTWTSSFVLTRPIIGGYLIIGGYIIDAGVARSLLKSMSKQLGCKGVTRKWCLFSRLTTCVVLKTQVKCPKIMPFTDVSCTRAGSYPNQATPGALVAARGFGGGHGDFLGDMRKSRAC